MPVDLIIFFSPLPPRQFMDLGDKAKESFFILLFILILNFQGESTMFQQVLICFPQVIICSKIMTTSHSQVTFMIQTNMTHGQAMQLSVLLCVTFQDSWHPLKQKLPSYFQPTNMRLHGVWSTVTSTLPSSFILLCSSHPGLLKVPVPQAWKVIPWIWDLAFALFPPFFPICTQM